MFDKLKAMGAVASLMKNQDGLRDAAARVREKSEQTRVTGEAGGGACRVVAAGNMKIISVELSSALVAGMAADERTRQLASSLVADAVNDALRHAQERLQEQISVEAKALGLGDLPTGDLGGLLG
jgi:DNA-binding protein YbaB